METISVIIPVYNVINYIKNSLNSIINQTIFNQLQIIIVDDGSTDGSGEICDIMLSSFDNVEIYHQKNSGVSSARNFALTKVKGDYVTFFDPDDILDSDTYEYMLDGLKKHNVDIFAIDMESEITKTSLRNNRLKNNYYCKNQEQFLIDYFQDCGVFPSCCDKLFKIEILKNLQFSHDIKIHEDGLFLYYALKNSSAIYYDTSVVKYHRTIRKDSATQERFNDNRLTALKALKEMYNDASILVKPYIDGYYFYYLFNLLVILYNSNEISRYKKLLMSQFEQYKIDEIKKYIPKNQYERKIVMVYKCRKIYFPILRIKNYIKNKSLDIKNSA